MKSLLQKFIAIIGSCGAKLHFYLYASAYPVLKIQEGKKNNVKKNTCYKVFYARV